MNKILLVILSVVLSIQTNAQQKNYWSTDIPAGILPEKSVLRASFPKVFRLYTLNTEALKQDLFSVVDNRVAHTSVISLPNSNGEPEFFEVVEASNFEPALQELFPAIRAFSGKGISDKYATLKLSYSPQGIQGMVFRVGKENEFIESYSAGYSVYAVYSAQARPGRLPWTCSTVESKMLANLFDQVSTVAARSGGNLKTLRLAQSVTAEYSNYFGATNSSQVAVVLSAINATLTRCNGIFERDLALHLNLISNTTSVIYYTASTDPYSPASTGTGGAWNNELQNTLTSVIGESNYDIGHLFGASGGGGNAGCIGCVCTNGQKGKGYTSPADGVPRGDNFDIDYVVHEIGHQLGANHTFSMSNEGTGVNKEPGSGITIMGYAGITAQDLAPHSIAAFHQASIDQIQNNLNTRKCAVTIPISNATPVVAGNLNYTIPKSTPFALTGSATDANAGDVLTYSWEQNDNASTSQTGSSSVASATKSSGPNWISYIPSTTPTRFFPKLSTILSGGLISGPLSGGDAGANTEAISSVARTLNFRFTVRDNAPYSSTSPVSVGQTQYADVVVTVSSASGPFNVTAPNTTVSYAGGSSQTITWNVAGTTATPVSCASVRISLSTDGGQSFPVVLNSSTPNDGSQQVVIPNIPTTAARIKVEAVGNIFFDISNTNFTITAGISCSAPTGLSASAITPSSANVSWNAGTNVLNYTVDYKLTSSPAWINAAAGTTGTSVNITGLMQGSIYDWRVRANCNSGSSVYNAAQFTTTLNACATAFEYNDTQASAAAVIPGVTNSAAISTSTDVDYYKITTSGTSNIVFNLVGPEGVDYDMAVYNSAGTQIGFGTSSTSTESVTLNSQATGTYYIRIYGYQGAYSATCYTIKATATLVTGCSSPYDNTSNGTMTGAATIPFNTNITGLINAAGDVDYYKFMISTGGTITITLGTLPGDYDLKLLTSNGAQVGLSQAGGTTSETISYYAAAGTYYVQVYGYNNANHSSTCYTLKVQLGTATKESAPLITGTIKL